MLAKHPQIVIASDEMYEHIYWAPEPFTSFAQANPHLYDRTITINGVSKAYAMTGWRIGYCGGPKEIVAAMATIQGQSTSNASSISQRAATVALNGDQTCVTEMNKAFKARHDFVVAGLNAIPGISCLPGAGTFYAFADVEGAMRALGLKDDNAVCRIPAGERRRCRGSRIRLRRARPHAHLLRLQHGDPEGGAEPHPARGCSAQSPNAPKGSTNAMRSALSAGALIGRCFLDLQARLPDNPRLFRFPGSSVVERRTVNPLVGGSNPSRGAIKSIT